MHKLTYYEKISLKNKTPEEAEQITKLFKDKFPSDFIKKDIKERTLIINRILKINNLMSSTMNALMGLYSSPDINYILDKYRKKLSIV